MPVEHIGRDDDQGVARDALSGELGRPACRSGYSHYGGIEPHRLVEHRAGFDEPVGDAFRREACPLELTLRLRRNALAPLR